MRLLHTLFLVMLVGLVGCNSRAAARREAVRRKQANNLKQLGLAMHAYHEKHAAAAGQQNLEAIDQVHDMIPANAEDSEHQVEKSTTASDVLPERGP